jgi:hypothetical protein
LEFSIFVILVLLLTCQAVFLAIICLKTWRTEPENLILLFVLYSNFLWSVPPAIVALVADDIEFYSFGYPLAYWDFGLLLEFVFFCIFIFVWILGRRRTPLIREQVLRSSTIHFVVVVALLAGAFYFLLTGPWTGAGYETAGDYVKANLASDEVTIGGIQNTVYRDFVLPSIAVLIFYLPRNRVPKLALALGVGVLIYACFNALASGARGRIVEVAFLIGSCYMAKGATKKASAYLLVGVVGAALLSAALMEFRSSAVEHKGLSVVDKSTAVLDAYGIGHSEPGSLAWFRRYLLRLDSIQNGGILARRADQSSHYALYRPFVGSFVAYIPRYLWTEKPLPMSEDGTAGGLPWYLVMAYRGEPWNNGSVSTSGIAYWQFGWFGVMATAILGALIARGLSHMAFRGGPIGVMVFVSYCMMTHFRIPVGIDESMFAGAQVGLPTLLLYGLYLGVAQAALAPNDRKVLRRAEVAEDCEKVRA